MGSNGALYQVVLVVHILCAVVGFGSILVTGGYASAARRGSKVGQVSRAVRRYFRPGANLASRLIYAVPVLGLILVGMSGGGLRFLDQFWLVLGSGLWLLAAGLATGVVWPAEARMSSLVSGTVVPGPGGGQGELAAVGGGQGDPRAEAGGAGVGSAGGGLGRDELGAAIARVGRRASWAAAVMDLAVVAAFVVMIGRPS